MRDFEATHIIFSDDEHIPVRFDDGAFYTSAEWSSQTQASWELTDLGLRFQGEIRDGYGYRRIIAAGDREDICGSAYLRQAIETVQSGELGTEAFNEAWQLCCMRLGDSELDLLCRALAFKVLGEGWRLVQGGELAISSDGRVLDFTSASPALRLQEPGDDDADVVLFAAASGSPEYLDMIEEMARIV